MNDRPAPIVRWSRVGARLVASLVVLGLAIWLGKHVVRSSSADRAPRVRQPTSPEADHRGDRRGEVAGSAQRLGADATSTHAGPSSRPVSLFAGLDGHGPQATGRMPVPLSSRPASPFAGLDELLAGSGGGLAAAGSAGETFDGVDPPDVPILPTARRLYGIQEPASSAGGGPSFVAVYRVGGTIEQVVDQMDRAMAAAGWKRGSTPPGTERRGAIACFYEKAVRNAVVYVSADMKGDSDAPPATTLVVQVSTDRKDQ